MSGAFDKIAQAEADIEAASSAFAACGENYLAAVDSITGAVSAQQSAVETLRALPSTLKLKSGEAQVIALFLAYVDAEREKYSGMPLGDAMADAFAAHKRLSEAERHGLQLRIARGLGRLEQKAYQAENNSRSGSERAAEWPQAQFNCRVEKALAEVTLPTKSGERVRAAVKHLKAKHLHLWDATAPGAAWPVRLSTA